VTVSYEPQSVLDARPNEVEIAGFISSAVQLAKVAISGPGSGGVEDRNRGVWSGTIRYAGSDRTCEQQQLYGAVTFNIRLVLPSTFTSHPLRTTTVREKRGLCGHGMEAHTGCGTWPRM
jgi:hypothetical protein